MNQLDEIRDDVIRRSFPEFLNRKILVEYETLDDAFFESGEFDDGSSYIEADEEMKDAPRECVEGGIAHELAHIHKELGMNWLVSWLDGLLYDRCRLYRERGERKTDVEVINRGYGTQLLALSQYSEERGYQHVRENGLSVVEIQQILSAGK